MKKFAFLLFALASWLCASAQDTTTMCHGESMVLSMASMPSGLSVQWFKDGVFVSGDSAYVITEPGTYTVVCENGIGCISQTSDPLTVLRSSIVAVNDTSFADPNTPIDIGILLNDDSPCFPMDTITLGVVLPPSNGSVVHDGHGKFIYTPDPGFLGVDMFTYVIYDVNGNPSNTATVLILVSDGGPLDVALSRFEAIKQGKESLLSWTTMSTRNASHFEVERSGDGSEFTYLGRVEATANSNYAIDYRLVDQAPLPGKNFYRLKMVDVNGLFKYSMVRVVEFDLLSEMRIYPNPAQDVINIEMGAAAAFIKELALIDVQGRIMMRYPVSKATETLNISSLASATYYLRFIGKDNSIKGNIKVSKIN